MKDLWKPELAVQRPSKEPTQRKRNSIVSCGAAAGDARIWAFRTHYGENLGQETFFRIFLRKMWYLDIGKTGDSTLGKYKLYCKEIGMRWIIKQEICISFSIIWGFQLKFLSSDISSHSQIYVQSQMTHCDFPQYLCILSTPWQEGRSKYLIHVSSDRWCLQGMHLNRLHSSATLVISSHRINEYHSSQ